MADLHADGSEIEARGGDLMVGDIVEVIEMHLTGAYREKAYRAAQVIEVSPRSFAVRLVNGDFGEPGVQLKWLQKDMRGTTWR